MKTPLSYYGGKQRMLKHILPRIPNHQVYVEPFCGGGAVFWAKAPAAVEVINDRNTQIVNFYKALATNPEALAAAIIGSSHSRLLYEFSNVVLTYPEFFDEIRRAWAVWMQCNQSFASSIGNSWGYSKSASKSGKDTTALKVANKRVQFSETESLEAFKNRLQQVQIECSDALRIIAARDTAATFFYVDPPYPESNQGHYKGYTMADFEALLKLLKEVQGKFMLSCYHYDILQQYIDDHGWHLVMVDQVLSASKAVAGQPRKRKVECLATNYPI